MPLESFSRLSRSIVDAAEVANKDEARKAAALVVNSIGSMVTPKSSETKRQGDGRVYQFEKVASDLGDMIEAARNRRTTEAKTKTEQPKAQKSLAQLLVEAQDRV